MILNFVWLNLIFVKVVPKVRRKLVNNLRNNHIDTKVIKTFLLEPPLPIRYYVTNMKRKNVLQKYYAVTNTLVVGTYVFR